MRKSINSFTINSLEFITDTADRPSEGMGVQDSERERGWLMTEGGVSLEKYECRSIARILGRNNS